MMVAWAYDSGLQALSGYVGPPALSVSLQLEKRKCLITESCCESITM